MKKSLILVLTLAVCLFGGTGYLGYKVLTGDEPIIEQPNDKYTIEVMEEMDVYQGGYFILAPKLVDGNGKYKNGNFHYSSSNNSVSIKSTGEITINAIPTEDVYINIVEQTTGLETKVKINVISELINVGEVTPKENTLIYKNKVILDVTTLPANINLEEYFNENSYVVYNELNEEVENVFEVEIVDNSHIALNPIGLGKGKIEFSFVNACAVLSFTTI